MMTKKYLSILAAILCCAMTMAVMTACTDDDITSSVVDDKKWNVTDDFKDKSVKAGDDFYMYCNGGYWNSTAVDEETGLKAYVLDQMDDWVTLCLMSTSIPSADKMTAYAAKTDAATVMAQMDKLQSAIDRIDALTTKEEAWKLTAELMKEGYPTPFQISLFSHNGKIACVLRDADDPDYTDPDEVLKQSFEWRIKNDPELLACLRPLNSIATRGFDGDKWPMLVTIFNTLGISLDDVYLFDSYPLAITNNLVEVAMAMLADMQNGKDVDDWKSVLKEYVKYDELYFDSEKLAEYNKTASSPITLEGAINNFSARFLKYETSYVFGTQYVTAEMKQRTTQLCEDLRQTFRKRIQSNTWMSEASKQKALDKLAAMTFNIGSPDTWYEEGIPNISNEKTLYDDLLAIRGALFNLQKKLLGQPTNSNSFHLIILESPLTTVNAFYVPNYNSINIYPMWMVKPGYDAEQNEAHNYATMAVFGHEITHGFDTSGSQFNKVGDLEDIWASDADRQEFSRRAQLLIDLYNTFEVMPLSGVHCDGAHTAGENIADLGGLQIAYDDYVNHLTAQGFEGEQLTLQKQRFFEAFAYHWCAKWTAGFAEARTLGLDGDPSKKDEHALFRERVNGVVMNTPDWYDLFDVKQGDKLYLAPEKRIIIW